jgi:thiamine biosynthesis lipoprotein
MSTGGRPTRRDFLQGRAVVQVVVGAVAGPDVGSMESSERTLSVAGAANRLAPGVLTNLGRRAMACEFEVQLAAGRRDGSTERVLAALDLVESLEDQMTVYRADSEIIRINRRAADGPVPVEPRLFAMFQLAERVYRGTEGAFDITSGPLSEVWGFTRRQGRLPSDAEIAAARERVGMDAVVLDAEHHSVAFQRPGLSLHLNSIGKGYALDRMAEMLDAGSVGDYLLHGGRSSVLARGDCPEGGQPGWTIGMPHPLRPGERLTEVTLVNQALGTSGSGTQSFEQAGRRYGHLLDPRTGWPAEGILSATAIAPTAAEADALSTAFYVMGPEKVQRYCAERPDVAAVLVCPGNHEDGVQLRLFGSAGRI